MNQCNIVGATRPLVATRHRPPLRAMMRLQLGVSSETIIAAHEKATIAARTILVISNGIDDEVIDRAMTAEPTGSPDNERLRPIWRGRPSALPVTHSEPKPSVKETACPSGGSPTLPA